MKRFFTLIALAAMEIVVLLMPLAITLWSLGNQHWIIAALGGASYFALRQLCFVIENFFGVRSPSNPDSVRLGSGITFVAPWLRKRLEVKESIRRDKTKAKNPKLPGKQ